MEIPELNNNLSDEQPAQGKGLSLFERYLTLWILLCIAGGMLLGKLAPGLAQWLDGQAIYVNQAPVISVPIAICLFCRDCSNNTEYF